MKIIHLSDTHVDPEILYKIDSQQRFRQALDHIKDNHTDADHFMITGDLTPVSYTHLTLPTKA